ncbi:MAG: response regulator [Actinobacteria bacterium]|nr:MAG: response regulator [Actinomycetota bacterium]
MGVGHSVLVVDDEPSIRLLCKVNLELEGYRVLEADTLAEARRHLRENDVDAVLLDVHVGAEDGRKLVQEIRSVRPSTGIALFSGSSEVGAAASAGADAVIPKPFVLEHLIRTVGRLVHGARV